MDAHGKVGVLEELFEEVLALKFVKERHCYKNMQGKQTSRSLNLSPFRKVNEMGE